MSYAIGVAKPVSIFVDTYGTGIFSDEIISSWINDTYDLRPGKIIEKLKLKEQKYFPTAAYGHFGRIDINVSWETLEDDLKNKIETYMQMK